MIRVDGFYLYRFGSVVSRLTTLTQETSKRHALSRLFQAQTEIQNLLSNSIFRIKNSRPRGVELLKEIETLIDKILGKNPDELDKPPDFLEVFVVQQSANDFQTVLASELQFADLYYVTGKGGFDLATLTEFGEIIFPSELATKVPEAVHDARSAARCIAFELPTAAGFHLHRANETVLHKYFDVVTSGTKRPNGRSMGRYIDELEQRRAGDKKVIAGLKSIKDLHRNPLIHPEQSLKTTEEAIALHGAIFSVMVHMLAAI